VAALAFTGCPDTGKTSSETVVNKTAITLDAPVTGVLAATFVDEEQFTGRVTWSPVIQGGVFDAGQEYTAKIALTAKAGFTLKGATGFTVNGQAAEFDGSVVTSAKFPATIAGSGVVTHRTIKLTAPVTDATPETAIGTDSQFSGTVTWSGNPTKFEARTPYTATIALTATEGWTFAGLDERFFSIEGYAALVTFTGSGTTGTVTAKFPETGGTGVGSDVDPVTAKDINGLTAPAVGLVPVTSFVNQQFTGAVTWTPTHSTFQSGQTYTANVTLTAAKGWTFDGVGAGFFNKVPGSDETTNTAGTGNTIAVTVNFPAARSNTITHLNIRVTPPVTGQVPDTRELTDLETPVQYTATVTWQPAHPTFQSHTVYRVAIAVKPAAGFTVEELGVNCFIVNGVRYDSVTREGPVNNAGSGAVVYEFPATDKSINFATPFYDAGAASNNQVWSSVELDEPAFSIGGNTPASTTPPYGGVYPSTAWTYNGGLTAPGYPNVMAVSTLRDSNFWEGRVTWNPLIDITDSLFKAATVYTATIKLTAREGYTLAGVPANFFKVTSPQVNGASAYAAGSDTVTVTYYTTPGTATDPAKIDMRTLKGVKAPETGIASQGVAADIGAITGSTGALSTAQYTVDSITWLGGSNNLTPGTAFGASTVYTATITLSPQTGYKFDGDDTMTVEGVGTGTVSKTLTGTGNSQKLVLTVIYPQTAANAGTKVVTDKMLFRVPIPVTGRSSTQTVGSSPTALPDVVSNTTAANNQFSATVASITWTPSATTFATGISYRATITLAGTGTAPNQYTFNGVTANYFDMDGKPTGTTVANSANSGIVTIVFPPTEGDPIDNTNYMASASPSTYRVAILGLTVPRVGEVPVKTVAAGAATSGSNDFSYDVTWSPNDTRFKYNVLYTATLTIKPAAGKSVMGTPANFYSVAGAAEPPTNAANSATVTVKFPTPSEGIMGKGDHGDGVPGGAAATPESEIWGVKVPLTADDLYTTVTETESYTGTIQWNSVPVPTAGATKFESAKKYRATITLDPKPGYTATGLPINHFDLPATIKAVSGVNVTQNVADNAVIVVDFPVCDTTLSDNILTTALLPNAVAGEQPKAVAAITTANIFKATDLQWSPAIINNPGNLLFNGRFASGNNTNINLGPAGTGSGIVYTATLTLQAEKGGATKYTMRGIGVNYFKPQTGATYTITHPAYNNSLPDTDPNYEKLVLTITFASTEKTISVDAGTGTANGRAIPGILLPKTGDAAMPALTPDPAPAITTSRKIETAQYTGVVTWDATAGNINVGATAGSPLLGKYAAAIHPVATIVLTPKAGYTFYGVPENFFRIFTTQNASGVWGGPSTELAAGETAPTAPGTPAVTEARLFYNATTNGGPLNAVPGANITLKAYYPLTETVVGTTVAGTTSSLAGLKPTGGTALPAGPSATPTQFTLTSFNYKDGNGQDVETPAAASSGVVYTSTIVLTRVTDPVGTTPTLFTFAGLDNTGVAALFPDLGAGSVVIQSPATITSSTNSITLFVVWPPL